MIILLKEILKEARALGWKKIIFFLVLILAVMGVSEAVGKLITPYCGGLLEYGYLGVFFGALLANATIFAPAPFAAVLLPFAISLAHQHDYFTVAATYAAGAACGEATSYLVGRFGRKLIFGNGEKEQGVRKRNLAIRLQGRIKEGLANGFKSATNQGAFKKIEKWLADHGWKAVFVLSAQPIIPFDLAGLAAGISKYPLWKFLISSFAGRVPKYLAMFLIGIESSNLLSWLWHWFQCMF